MFWCPWCPNVPAAHCPNSRGFDFEAQGFLAIWAVAEVCRNLTLAIPCQELFYPRQVSWIACAWLLNLITIFILSVVILSVHNYLLIVHCQHLNLAFIRDASSKATNRDDPSDNEIRRWHMQGPAKSFEHPQTVKARGNIYLDPLFPLAKHNHVW